jgi:uncharacterized Fe-S cluster protein YjdI/CDGSH-type Zn-finger protein
MDDKLLLESEKRKRTGVEREYRSRKDEIVVYWEPRICNHTGNCFRGLPEVFQPQNRPWVLVDAASADKIAEVVMTCPTGALHFERSDGGPQEPEPEETTIDARPNGPLHVRGRVRIMGPGGQLIREDTRVALCRCGASQNKPFCDGTHRRIGFRTANPPERSAE